MAKDIKDFPSGFNGDKAYAQVRLGVTFFFSSISTRGSPNKHASVTAAPEPKMGRPEKGNRKGA